MTTNLEECGPCPVFASFTLAFALQVTKKHGKTSVRIYRIQMRLECKQKWKINYTDNAKKKKKSFDVLNSIKMTRCLTRTVKFRFAVLWTSLMGFVILFDI